MQPYKNLSKAIHREGYIFILIFAVISFILFSFNTNFGWIGFVMTAWCTYFFRNPDRITPVADNLIISAADGIVSKIIEENAPEELGLEGQEMIRVSVFLNVFNVHVNRIPAIGKILALKYHPGKFFNACLDKASKENERQSVLMQTPKGDKIAFIQIAGLIARRIVCDLEEEQEVRAGQRFGIIRFGSRVDIYLPKNTAILVSEGQTCIGGETIIADMNLNSNKVHGFEIQS